MPKFVIPKRDPVAQAMGRRGGLKRSVKKRAAGARNLQKAREALAQKRLDEKAERDGKILSSVNPT